MNLSTTSIVLIFLLVIALALGFSVFFSPFENRDKDAFRGFERQEREQIEEFEDDELFTPMER